MLAAASLPASAAAYATLFKGGVVERAALSPDVATSRADADRLEGVHASLDDPLAARVLAGAVYAALLTTDYIRAAAPNRRRPAPAPAA